jgi:hypothetical protein
LWTRQLAEVSHIRVLADDDQAGRDHGVKVEKELANKKVQILLPAKGSDVSDHLAAGLGLDALVPFTARPEETTPNGKKASNGRRIRLTWADTITPEPVTWAWLDHGAGRLPIGCLALAAGREGTGKSSFGIWLAARVTTGKLPGALFGTPRKVLYAAVEDSWKHTIVPRLIAAGSRPGNGGSRRCRHPRRGERHRARAARR